MSQRILDWGSAPHKDAVVELPIVAVWLGARPPPDQSRGARLVQDYDLLAHIVGHLLRDRAATSTALAAASARSF
jgi:hypothetical protein